MEPTKRPKVYDYYWLFAAERMLIFYKRLQGTSAPWTKDPILQKYKFCNAYRACDRVTQYLIKNICYQCGDISNEDLLFQIVAFRIFSNIDTWEALKCKLGHQPVLYDLENDIFETALSKIKEERGKLYTGAFILCANNAYGRTIKHLNHASMLKDMFLQQHIYERIVAATKLESIYQIIHQFPLMGDFMSYQIAVDINYSELIDFSENDFTKAGPGAIRGIEKVFSNTQRMSSSEVIDWMVEHQEREFDRLGVSFHGLFGRQLQAIDCQNLFCEVDKYCRVAVPEISSNRKRIKTIFHRNENPIEYFFPPKWKLNELIDSPLTYLPTIEIYK